MFIAFHSLAYFIFWSLGMIAVGIWIGKNV